MKCPETHRYKVTCFSESMNGVWHLSGIRWTWDEYDGRNLYWKYDKILFVEKIENIRLSANLSRSLENNYEMLLEVCKMIKIK